MEKNKLNMKKTPISLILCLLAFASFSQANGDPVITFGDEIGGGVRELTKDEVQNLFGNINGQIIVSGRYDCIPFTGFSAWKSDFIGHPDCIHEWIYAEFEDINSNSGITLMVYCQCGCPVHTNEARICKGCYRHESRTRTDGHNIQMKEDSEYIKLKAKVPKNK